MKGALLILAGAALWGTTGTAQALAPAGADPLTVGAVRTILGGIILVLWAAARGEIRVRGSWPFLPAAGAIISISAYQPLFFSGVRLAGVAAGTLVGIGSSPIITGALGWIFLKERPSGRWYLATAAALLGCFLLVPREGSRAEIGGIALAVAAGASYSVYTLCGKRLLASHSAASVTALVFAGASCLLAPLLFAKPPVWILSVRGSLAALHLGGVTLALAYGLFSAGLRRVSAAAGATLTLAEPLVASLLGVFLLGEKMTAAGAAGVVILFAGLAVLAAPIRSGPGASGRDR